MSGTNRLSWSGVIGFETHPYLPCLCQQKSEIKTTRFGGTIIVNTPTLSVACDSQTETEFECLWQNKMAGYRKSKTSQQEISG